MKMGEFAVIMRSPVFGRKSGTQTQVPQQDYPAY